MTPASLEILVIDTLGTNRPCFALTERGLTSVADHCPTRTPNVVLRWVTLNRPLNRPAAIECGIRNANGRFTLFLDDDDVLADQHVEKLYQGLLNRQGNGSQVVAVTTGVKLIHEAIGDQAPEHINTWDSALVRERLILANQLPLMSFIVETKTLRQCEMDHRLEIYEDWDLIIQLAALGHFIHLPGVTADYFFNPSGSGVHEQAKTKETSEAIRKKWLSAFKQADFEKLYQTLLSADRLAHENTVIRKQLATAEQELQLVITSQSWKRTKPLRDFKVWLHARSISRK